MPPAIGLDLANLAPRHAAQAPPRALGRCARGSVLRSLDAVIEVTYGELERERVVALLSDVHADHGDTLAGHQVDRPEHRAVAPDADRQVETPGEGALGRTQVG